MSKITIAALFTALLLGTGCKTTKSGNREFIPGKGWRSTQIELHHPIGLS